MAVLLKSVSTVVIGKMQRMQAVSLRSVIQAPCWHSISLHWQAGQPLRVEATLMVSRVCGKLLASVLR